MRIHSNIKIVYTIWPVEILNIFWRYDFVDNLDKYFSISDFKFPDFDNKLPVMFLGNLLLM